MSIIDSFLKDRLPIGDHIKIDRLDPTYKDYIALTKSIFKIIEFHNKDAKYTADYYKLEYYSGGEAAIRFLYDPLGSPDPPISRDSNLLIHDAFQDNECIKLKRKEKLKTICQKST